MSIQQILWGPGWVRATMIHLRDLVRVSTAGHEESAGCLWTLRVDCVPMSIYPIVQN